MLIRQAMNILVADDHPLYREALATILGELGPGVHILQAETFDDVTDRVSDPDTELDLILLDLYMTGGEWGAVIEDLRERRPGTPVIVISGSDSQKDAERAMKAGSYGYLPKSLDKDQILNALRLILTGGVSVQPRTRRFRREGGTACDDIDSRIASLTARQWEVLVEVGAGKSNKIIAQSLGMTVGTVKLHLSAILKRLGAANRTQVAIIASQIKPINYPVE